MAFVRIPGTVQVGALPSRAPGTARYMMITCISIIFLVCVGLPYPNPICIGVKFTEQMSKIQALKMLLLSCCSTGFAASVVLPLFWGDLWGFGRG